MPEDGYPTEEELEKIRKWDFEKDGDYHAFMDYVKTAGNYWGSWGWERDGEKYSVSTGGWSGNEDILSAMEENFVFWMMYWWSSRRGGHYEFGKIEVYLND